MEYRNGTCGSCNATYKIPASFTHDRARCKECGGTVVIGQATSETGAAESGLEPYVPSGKKGPGPSMKEKLLAQRREAAKPAPAKPARAATDDLGAGLDLGFDDDVEEQAPKKAPARAGRTAGPPASGSRKSGTTRASKREDADDEADEASRTSSRRGGRTAGRSGGRSGGSRRGGRRGGRRDEASGEKKKAGAPMIIGLVGLLVLLGGAGFLFREDLGFGAGDPVDAAGKDPAAKDGATPADGEAPRDANTPADGAADESADEAEPEQAPEVAEDDAPPAEDAEATKSRDPASVDLASIQDWKPVDGTTDEEWAEIQAEMTKAMDPGAAIGQTRAQKSLEERGRKAIPAILNHMKALDLSTESGTDQGMWSQRMLENITNGRNFGWKEYMDEAEKNGESYFHWFNKVVVQSWCKQWERASTDLDYWKTFAKLSDAELEALKEELGDAAPTPKDEEEPSDLDLLNED